MVGRGRACNVFSIQNKRSRRRRQVPKNGKARRERMRPVRRWEMPVSIVKSLPMGAVESEYRIYEPFSGTVRELVHNGRILGRKPCL